MDMEANCYEVDRRGQPVDYAKSDDLTNRNAQENSKSLRYSNEISDFKSELKTGNPSFKRGIELVAMIFGNWLKRAVSDSKIHFMMIQIEAARNCSKQNSNLSYCD